MSIKINEHNYKDFITPEFFAEIKEKDISEKIYGLEEDTYDKAFEDFVSYYYEDMGIEIDDAKKLWFALWTCLLLENKCLELSYEEYYEAIFAEMFIAFSILEDGICAFDFFWRELIYEFIKYKSFHTTIEDYDLEKSYMDKISYFDYNGSIWALRYTEIWDGYDYSSFTFENTGETEYKETYDYVCKTTKGD